MAALTATELTDERTLKQTRTRWEGKRVYKVNTGSVDVALLGNGSGLPAGLPAMGDMWDATLLPYCVVVGIEPKRLGGVDTDLANRTNAWTLVEVKYATIIEGSVPPPSTLSKFTKINASVGQVQAYFGIDPDTGNRVPGDPQLNNGNGASQDVGLVDYEVFVGLSPVQFAAVDYSRLISLHTRQSLNKENSVSLPPFLQSGVFNTFGKGQLRFRGFGFDDPDGSGNRFLRIQLAARTDHRVVWAVEGPDGEATGAEKTAFTYPYDDFAGLW